MGQVGGSGVIYFFVIGILLFLTTLACNGGPPSHG